MLLHLDHELTRLHYAQDFFALFFLYLCCAIPSVTPLSFRNRVHVCECVFV